MQLFQITQSPEKLRFDPISPKPGSYPIAFDFTRHWCYICRMFRSIFCIVCSLVALLFLTIVLMTEDTYALGTSCKFQEKFSLAVHGGAVWGNASHTKKEAFIEAQLHIGHKNLENGGKAIDVVEAVVAAMENSGLFNAGKGSIANQNGEIELDASIMDGRHLRAGSVASIRALQNPISAARLVMDNTPYVMMVGGPADQYIAQLGAKEVQQSYFLNSGISFSDISLPQDLELPKTDPGIPKLASNFTGVWGGVLDGKLNHVVILDKLSADGAEVIVALGANEGLGISEPSTTKVKAKFLNEFLIVETGIFRVAYRLADPGSMEAILSVKNGGRATGLLKMRPELIKKSGTVGAVAMDRCGNLAAGTSTGGFNSKPAGRVGDSPIIGAGTYADNRSVAVSATGHGEYFIRHAVAHEIAARIRHGKETLIQAAYQVIFKELKNNGGEGGVIAIDRNGEVVMLFNTDGMVRGRTTDKFQPKVETYSND